MTGSLPFKGINPDECVAMGACLQAGVLSGSVKGLLLLDVTPLSLGIETLGGVCTRIIERNTTLPIRKSQIFTTASSFQSSVDIHVLQGERPMAHQNKELGRFQLTGIRRAPRGVPQIEVTFSIDANGIVNVSAKDLGTGKHQEITLTQSTHMSDAEIEQAMRDAERYAAEDARRKESAEVRNQAEQLLYESKNAQRRLSREDKERIESLRKQVEQAMQGTDDGELKRRMAELTNALQAAGRYTDNSAADDADGAVDADFSDSHEEKH